MIYYILASACVLSIENRIERANTTNEKCVYIYYSSCLLQHANVFEWGEVLLIANIKLSTLIIYAYTHNIQYILLLLFNFSINRHSVFFNSFYVKSSKDHNHIPDETRRMEMKATTSSCTCTHVYYSSTSSFQRRIYQFASWNSYVNTPSCRNKFYTLLQYFAELRFTQH